MNSILYCESAERDIESTERDIIIPYYDMIKIDQNPLYPSLVKGGALKMHCGCFVGSNPTGGIRGAR